MCKATNLGSPNQPNLLNFSRLGNFIAYKRHRYTQKRVIYFAYSIFKFNLKASRINNNFENLIQN